MKRFKNIHKNKRAFIVCNGPSLNDMDVNHIKGEIVFGLNRGYLKKDLPITYLVVVNHLVEKQFGSEILKTPCKAIFSNSLPRTYIMKWTDGLIFQTDIEKPIWQGHTVTYVAMQIAYYMGCNPLYIIGLDHFYNYENTKKLDEKRGIVSQGYDPNHFHPDYFGKGVRWDPAKLDKSEESYKRARDTYEKAGRKIYNASTKTALSEDILPRVNFNEVV